MTTVTRPSVAVDGPNAVKIEDDRLPLGVCWLLWIVLGAASWSVILALV